MTFFDTKPLVTIYMPTKNRLKLLQRAVNSVLGQTYKNIELIIVDDGSSDGTDKYLQALANSDSRVSFFRNDESLGGPASRNLAIQSARGEFVTGLDDDDEFLENRIQGFVDHWFSLISRGISPSCLYSNVAISVDGCVTATSNKPSMATFADIFIKNIVGNQVFAPKDSFVDAGLFHEDLPAWQDMEMFMRILKKFGPGYLTPEVSYVVDASPRQDRVTLQAKARLIDACAFVMTRHAVTGLQKQQLLLQLYWFYPIRPGFSALIKFFSYGVRFKEITFLFLSLFRETARFLIRKIGFVGNGN